MPLTQTDNLVATDGYRFLPASHVPTGRTAMKLPFLVGGPQQSLPKGQGKARQGKARLAGSITHQTDKIILAGALCVSFVKAGRRFEHAAAARRLTDQFVCGCGRLWWGRRYWEIYVSERWRRREREREKRKKKKIERGQFR